MPTDALINVNGESVQALEILLLTTIMMLLPSLIIMMTSFTRYVVVFSFLRSAMGTQQTPPNMVLVGMALILTLFTMSPTLSAINEEAFQPYQEEEITQEEFFQRAQVPLKRFMIRWTRVESMELYCNMSGTPIPETEEATQDLPLTVIIPAFITSELKQAFFIGFLLYIPFMLIDMVVASTLMSMGMVMLPPSMISTPFKLLLFILLDGWQLLFSTLVRGFGLGQGGRMDTSVVTRIMREGVWVAIQLGGPMLILSMAVGVLVAIFQAVTQIHEQTLGFILKLIVVILVLLVGGGWMMETLLDYTRGLFELMVGV